MSEDDKIFQQKKQDKSKRSAQPKPPKIDKKKLKGDDKQEDTIQNLQEDIKQTQPEQQEQELKDLSKESTKTSKATSRSKSKPKFKKAVENSDDQNSSSSQNDEASIIDDEKDPHQRDRLVPIEKPHPENFQVKLSYVKKYNRYFANHFVSRQLAFLKTPMAKTLPLSFLGQYSSKNSLYNSLFSSELERHVYTGSSYVWSLEFDKQQTKEVIKSLMYCQNGCYLPQRISCHLCQCFQIRVSKVPILLGLIKQLKVKHGGQFERYLMRVAICNLEQYKNKQAFKQVVISNVFAVPIKPDFSGFADIPVSCSDKKFSTQDNCLFRCRVNLLEHRQAFAVFEFTALYSDGNRKYEVCLANSLLSLGLEEFPEVTGDKYAERLVQQLKRHTACDYNCKLVKMLRKELLEQDVSKIESSMSEYDWCNGVASRSFKLEQFVGSSLLLGDKGTVNKYDLSLDKKGFYSKARDQADHEHDFTPSVLQVAVTRVSAHKDRGRMSHLPENFIVPIGALRVCDHATALSASLGNSLFGNQKGAVDYEFAETAVLISRQQTRSSFQGIYCLRQLIDGFGKYATFLSKGDENHNSSCMFYILSAVFNHFYKNLANSNAVNVMKSVYLEPLSYKFTDRCTLGDFERIVRLVGSQLRRYPSLYSRSLPWREELRHFSSILFEEDGVAGAFD